MISVSSLSTAAFAALAATAGVGQTRLVNHGPNVHEVREERQATAVKAHEARLAEQAHIAHHRADMRSADLNRFHKKEAERHDYEAKHDGARPKL